MPQMSRRFSPTKPKGPYEKCPDCGGWKAIKAYRCRYCTPKIREAGERRWRQDATHTAARHRARVRYPVPLECQRCNEAAVIERHHKDGDPLNNEPENIAMLCRRCHMEVDGRMEPFRRYSQPIQDPQPCSACGRLSKPLRRGLCHACNERSRRRRKRGESTLGLDAYDSLPTRDQALYRSIDEWNATSDKAWELR